MDIIRLRNRDNMPNLQEDNGKKEQKIKNGIHHHSKKMKMRVQPKEVSKRLIYQPNKEMFTNCELSR